MTIEPAPDATLFVEVLKLLGRRHPQRTVGPSLEKIAALLGQIEQLYRDMPNEVEGDTRQGEA